MTKNRKSLLALLAVIVVIGVALGTRMLMWNDAVLGGPFTLTDGQGRTVTEKSFPGKWPVIYFGYTFCPDVCPTSLTVLTLAMDKMPPDVLDRLAPIFISVDPERDTPVIAAAYAQSFHPNLIGLSGTPEQIAAMTKAYRVYAKKVAGDEPNIYTIDHTSLFFLLDPNGKFVRAFPAHDTTPAELAQTLTKATQ